MIFPNYYRLHPNYSTQGKLNGSVSNGGAGGSSGVRDRLSEVAIAKRNTK